MFATETPAIVASSSRRPLSDRSVAAWSEAGVDMTRRPARRRRERVERADDTGVGRILLDGTPGAGSVDQRSFGFIEWIGAVGCIDIRVMCDEAVHAVVAV
ncbi:hypothetical protein PTKU15_11260 [Paraburkholderia terrae]|nr:hypothetical protein PTKU15_11260 [Paraburkholderia terrae]